MHVGMAAVDDEREPVGFGRTGLLGHQRHVVGEVRRRVERKTHRQVFVEEHRSAQRRRVEIGRECTDDPRRRPRRRLRLSPPPRPGGKAARHCRAQGRHRFTACVSLHGAASYARHDRPVSPVRVPVSVASAGHAPRYDPAMVAPRLRLPRRRGAGLPAGRRRHVGSRPRARAGPGPSAAHLRVPDALRRDVARRRRVPDLQDGPRADAPRHGAHLPDSLRRLREGAGQVPDLRPRARRSDRVGGVALRRRGQRLDGAATVPGRHGGGARAEVTGPRQPQPATRRAVLHGLRLLASRRGRVSLARRVPSLSLRRLHEAARGRQDHGRDRRASSRRKRPIRKRS